MDAEIRARLDELDARIARLEGGTGPPPGDGGPDPEAFWALIGLRERETTANGAVLFTGTVTLPTGEHYEWQHGTRTDDVLDLDWSELSGALAALGHSVRLNLLREVLGGRRTVTELQELDEVGTTGQVYHHLRQLVAANWLQSAGRGRYSVPGHRVIPLLALLSAAHSPIAGQD